MYAIEKCIVFVKEKFGLKGILPLPVFYDLLLPKFSKRESRCNR